MEGLNSDDENMGNKSAKPIKKANLRLKVVRKLKCILEKKWARSNKAIKLLKKQTLYQCINATESPRKHLQELRELKLRRRRMKRLLQYLCKQEKIYETEVLRRAKEIVKSGKCETKTEKKDKCKCPNSRK